MADDKTNDMMEMPVRELIKGLRDKATLAIDTQGLIIQGLLFNILANRLEMEADRADALQKEKEGWDEKFEVLMACKPSAEALDQIADVMHHMKAPSEYVRAINEWSDHVRKADAIVGTGS